MNSICGKSYVIEKFVQLYLLKLQFEAGKHTERDRHMTEIEKNV